MITVRVKRGPGARICGFSVTGHSGYADPGADIVCAGVSAIVQTTILGLQNVLGINCRGRQAAGELHCALPEDLGDAAAASEALLATMLQGLNAMTEIYADYVRILDSNGANR